MELVAVTNDRLEVKQLAGIMCEVAPIVDYFIIRERSKTAADIIKLMGYLTHAGIEKDKLIMNDRVDVAVAAGIKRVQLPGHGLEVQQVKSCFPDIQAGRSVHSLKEAAEAIGAGADWLIYGHVFETDCKKGVPARGFQELQRIAGTVTSNIYAIGGIKPFHLKELHEVQIKGAAIMSGIFDSPTPYAAAKEYSEACRLQHSVERN
ncbi:thiamine phosphate synthase [Siminovitchia sediminis]|uniref:Thiamine phosphate synthase n=1 Tax=Siminovitchia sediminis TaxID=1274353 RepID=A0ABW4KER6_9BACI